MAAHYFLGSRLVGTGSLHWWDSTRLASASHVLVCPECGDSWGRILDDAHPRDWLPMRSSCPQHPGFIDKWPGSFLPPWPIPFDRYPQDLLRREFLLAFSHLVQKGTP